MAATYMARSSGHARSSCNAVTLHMCASYEAIRELSGHARYLKGSTWTNVKMALYCLPASLYCLSGESTTSKAARL